MTKIPEIDTCTVQYNIGNNVIKYNVKFYRKQHNLTQMQLGKRTGLQRTYIAEIESGVRNPTISKVFQIAIGLRIEPWRLLKPLSSKELFYGIENDFTPLDYTLTESKLLTIELYKENLIKNIKYLRKKRGWNQDKLAQLSGLSVIFIRYIEQDKKEPTLESLSKIAMAFHIPLWTLVNGIDSNSIWFNHDMWL